MQYVCEKCLDIVPEEEICGGPKIVGDCEWCDATKTKLWTVKTNLDEDDE
jgi:hypothetical protein